MLRIRGSSHPVAPLGVMAMAVAFVVSFVTPAWAARPGPDTVIDSGPGASTSSTSASFTFHSTSSGATFSCKLDLASYAACASPKAYTGLAVGSHTFSVFATANGLSDPSPATYTWRVDTSSPTAPTNLSASTPTATSVALTWTASTDNIGVTGNDVYRDGSKLASLGAVTSYTDATVTAGSTHTYAVLAKDAAGNSSPVSTSTSITTPLATPAPDTVIDSAPAPPPAATTSTSATFTFHSTLSGATFSCRRDGSTAASCTSPLTYSRLTEGTHTFSVAATVNGQTDLTPATATWIIDLTAPSVPTGLTAVPTASSVAVTWTSSTDNVGVVGYDVFRGGVLLASVGTITTYTDTAVTLGTSYFYSVRAKDAAGNLSPLSANVSATMSSGYDPHLTRAPYLTDLVGQHVAINFATDQSGTSASITYGAVDGTGSCSPATTASANRITIQVGTLFEYQWTAQVTLPATGSYCYRIYLGTSDLLAGNPSPRFASQVPFGSTSAFTFDVMGDWGQIDAAGNNTDQANLLARVAKSGARFAVTVGDNGYPTGSQVDYGDLQHPATSAIFGARYWTVPGSSIPIFTAAGNHGLAGVQHTDITTWTQASAVATSGGRYQNDVYCCVNGSFSSNYGSEWYAFDAGNARFYILDSAWGDTNGGTASPYENDALAHFAPGTPQYQWLLNDLQTHTPQLKFAFSHYPVYSDNKSQPSDTFLQGATNLEGLLGQHGVQILFNGHAHIYQRNNASATGMPITYVTGGGGGTLEPVGPCVTSIDAYAIGWSPTNLVGSTCGSAKPPASAANVFHFLKVSVSGTSVTVTPTDSQGNTFDVRTYTFKVPPDTYLDSAPAVGTTSSTASFAFHASGSPSTFTCKLDASANTACTSPITYTGLAQQAHTFTVAATVNKSKDPTPATYTWTVDSMAPSTPASFTATAQSPFKVGLDWVASTDNTGVTGYDLFRDGAPYQSLGPVTSYTDTGVLGSSTHTYSVRARDIAGNVSSLTVTLSVTTPPPPVPVFADGFESGTLSLWTPTSGLVVEGTTVHGGTHAVEGNTSNGGTYAKLTLPGTYGDAFARLWFDVIAQPSQVNLLRFRDALGNSLGYAYIETTGQLGFHNDTTGTNTLSSVIPTPGWHALELHLGVGSAPGVLGTAEIWLDNALVTDLSSTAVDVGSTPVSIMQLGEVQTGLTYDVAFDDVAFGTSRLGPVADSTPPTVPSAVTATATSAFAVQVGWSASSDDVGVSGYDVLRDGAVLGSVVAPSTSFTDPTALDSTSYQYTVRARDGAGNVSALSAPTSVTTPAGATPVFSDGFETGDLTGWTTTSGLTAQSTTVRSGGFAAETNSPTGATYAKKTLTGGPYADAYARVAFTAQTQNAQVTLLRLRDTAVGNGGFVYLSAGGHLAFRSDALTIATTSAVVPGPGWHVLELHLQVGSAPGGLGTVEVWLDGVLVPDLSSTAIDIGTAAIGVMQIGETATSTTGWDIAFDDAAFGTSRLGPVGDTTPPTTPGSFTASATSAFEVQLGWTASTDDVGVTSYDVLRDGAVLLTLPSTATGYTDSTVLASSTHAFAVRARDGAGNVSAASAEVSVSTPAAATPVFSDGFETGDLTGWTSSTGLNTQSTTVRSGGFAAEANVTAAVANARKTLPGGPYPDAYARVAVQVNSQSSQAILLRLRDSAGIGGYVYLTAGGKLGFRSDALTAGTTSTLSPGAGWHVVELRLSPNGASSTVEVWMDGVLVSSLSGGVNLGLAGAVTSMQVGDTAAVTYDLLFDDAAFGTSRLGISGDTTAPTVPDNVTAVASSPFSVQVGWDASTDNTAVTGYDLFRDGSLFQSLGNVTSYADGSVMNSSTHTYTVRARDLAANVSALSTPVSVTTPATATPVFADGFESGGFSGWTSAGGLVVESSDVRSGGFAAEGIATNGGISAKTTLPSGSYTDAYARVGVEMKTLPNGTIGLLRLRDTASTSVGNVFLTSGGKLGFTQGQTGQLTTAVTSAVSLGIGWHTIELHVSVNGASSSYQVWLDGQLVAGLSGSFDLGAAGAVTILQVGDSSVVSGRAYDVVYDDAALSTSRVGI
jgi:fibronectin type 3 domain-containing protein